MTGLSESVKKAEEGVTTTSLTKVGWAVVRVRTARSAAVLASPAVLPSETALRPGQLDVLLAVGLG